MLLSGLQQVWGYDLGLMEAKELSASAPHWIILDARPRAEWRKGHIPGALSFSWEEYTRTDEKGVPYRIWPPEDLAKALGRMGMDERTPVAVYGDADTSWGGEGWACWVLTWLGHQGPIRLLDGGIQAWREKGLPMVQGEETPARPSATYRVTLRPEVLERTAAIPEDKGRITLVDVRSTMEWFMGSIPGAVHIPWTDFYHGPDHRPLSPSDVKALLTSNGVTLDKPVIYYCTGGVRSGYAWLMQELAGLGTTRNYEGGIEAWKRCAPGR